MMKLISFVGTSKYIETIYKDDDKKSSPSKFVQRALCEFLKPSQLLLLVTQEAKSMHLADLLDEIKPTGVEVSPIDIPSGRNESELWEIFSRLTDILEEGDRVIFDITHSFRSIPMLVLLAASYLRVAKQVHIDGVYYGAFDSKEESGETPIFNLTPFLELLNWTSATDQFLHTGDARGLARLLKGKHAAVWKQRTGQPDEELPKKLQSLAARLEEVSLALALGQPRNSLPRAAHIQRVLIEVESETEQWAQPFDILLDRIRKDYLSISLEKDAPLIEHLRTHRRLIHWYLERQQTMQAVSLAREWVVSLFCWRLKEEEWLERRTRENVERKLGELKGLHENSRGEGEGSNRESRIVLALLSELDLPDQSDFQDISACWSRISELRNQIDHCGMQKDSNDADSLMRNTEKLERDLDKLARITGLDNSV